MLNEFVLQIVFNVVASVKFNEKIGDAIDINVLGTKKILDLAMEMKNLKVCFTRNKRLKIAKESLAFVEKEKKNLLSKMSFHFCTKTNSMFSKQTVLVP